jgi:hypothetical protein
MRSPGIAIVLIVFLSGAAIHAQDDAGVGDAEGEAVASGDEWVVVIDDEAAPPQPPTAAAPVAPAVAPAAAQKVKAPLVVVPAVVELTPALVLKLDPDLYQGQERRLIISKQRKIRMLNEIMYKEGPEYNEDKDGKYKLVLFSGVLLVVGGAASLVSAFMVGVLSAFSGIGCGGEDDECKAESATESERGRTTALVLAPVGLLLVVTGVSLLIYGHQGHDRQKWLRRKNEILDLSPLNGISVTVYPTQEGAAGGLMLSGTF